MFQPWFIETPAPDQAWAARGACRDHDPGLWFAEESDTAQRQQAETICRGCPVATECLDYALAVPRLQGIWGATTPRQRTRIRNGTVPRPHAA